jgi:hypothetical protein
VTQPPPENTEQIEQDAAPPEEPAAAPDAPVSPVADEAAAPTPAAPQRSLKHIYEPTRPY